MRSIEPQDPALTYAQVLDALPIIAYVARADGTISYVSRGWTEFTGVDPKNVLGDAYHSIIHPDQLGRVLATWDAARAAETAYRDEFLFMFGDGSSRWVLTQANPIRASDDGRVIGWFGTVTDIDDAKRDAEALHAQAAFNERLISSSDDCIKILDLEGRLLSMSANGVRLLGIRDIDAVLGSSWIDTWHGDDWHAAADAVSAARRGEIGRFAGYFPVGEKPRWFDVVVTAITDSVGRPERLLAVSRDITVQRATTEALKENEQRYRAFSEALPGMTWSASPAGDVEFVGDRWSETRGRPREAALGAAWLDTLHPDDREPTRVQWQSALATGEPYKTQFRVLMADGTYRWHLVRALPVRDDAGAIRRWIGVNVDVDEQRRAAAEREFLSEASRILAESLDVQTTLSNLAQLIVPQFADWCQIDLRAPQGRIVTAAVAHRDPAKHLLAQRFVGLVHRDPQASRGNAYAIRSGRSDLRDDVPALADDATERGLYNELGVQSAASIPLVAQGTTVGAMAVVYAESQRRYTSADLPMLEELGRRAGLAVQNASEFEHEHRVAESFQKASLPLALPAVRGVIFDAEYRPGSDEATIGGDWYDVFVLDDGRVAMTMGDVLGHGLQAAVTMTKLRQSMQAAAMMDSDPNVMLTVADKTLRLIDGDGYATAIAAIYDPLAHSLSFASAGHPGPIIRSPAGHVRSYASPGTMLGLRSRYENALATIPVSPGSTLVFYTDGLVEATRDIDWGQDRLREALTRPEIVADERPARAIRTFVLGETQASDDIAVLVARVTG